MNTGLISSRYADSLLEYAISMQQQEEVYDRIKLLSEVFRKMPSLRNAIMNPYLSRPDKKKILITACGGNIPSSLSKMINLILKNEREEALQYISLHFIDIYREKFNIQSGRLVTAIAVDYETEQRLIARIQEIAKSDVEVESIVDPGIIGGFVLTLGDYRWDASISGELTRIRNKLQKD